MFVNIASNDVIIIWNEIIYLISSIMPVCISVVALKVALKWLKGQLLGI